MTAVTNRPPPDAPPRARWRVLRIAGATVGLLITFVAALVAGVLLHTDLPVARRAVVARVNPVLGTLFHGRLELEGLERVGLNGAGGMSARLVDDDGVTVIIAHGLRARLSFVDVVRAALVGHGDLQISLSDVEIDSADVNLDTRADGRTRLEAAFEPRASGGTPGRPVRVDLPKIAVKHVWAHGRLPIFPPLDVDVFGIRGSVHVAPGRTRVDVTRADLVARGMPRGVDPVGAAVAHVVVPSAAGRKFGLESSFRGAIGGVPASGTFAFDGRHVEGAFDVRVARAAAVRAMFPEAPIEEDVSAQVEVHGDLPRLDARAHATIGGAMVAVQGPINLGDSLSGNVNIDATKIDARALAPSAPRTALGATARVAFAVLPDGAITGDFDADVARATLDQNTLPRALIHGDYRVRPAAGARATDVTVHGRGHLDEQGAPTDVVFTIAPDHGSEVLEVDARVIVPRLDATRLGAIAGGHARLHAVGKVRFADRSLDARVDGDVDNGTKGALRFTHAHVAARVTGPVGAPILDATVQSEGLALAGINFARGQAKAQGTPTALDVTLSLQGSSRAPDVEAHGLVAVATGVRVRNAHVSARREGVLAEADIAEVNVKGGELRVDGGVVDGLGEPLRIAFRRGGATLEAQVATRGIDLARLGTLLHASDQVRAGRLAIDAHLTATDRSVNGSVNADLVHGSILAAKDGNAHVDAIFEGRRVALHARASEGTFGSVELATCTLVIGGEGPLDVNAWKETWGEVDLAAKVDLAKLTTLLPPSHALPFTDVSGIVSVRGQLGRPAARGAAPTGHVSIVTTGLRVGSAKVVGLDVQLGASIDGPSGLAGLDGRVVDRRGVLFALDAKAATIRYREIMASDDVVGALMNVPFSARLVVPRRPFETLPIIGYQGRGDVEASLTVEGTAGEPKIDLVAHTYGVKSPQAPITNKIDAELRAQYGAGVADASLKARTPKAEVLQASAHVTAAVADFLGTRTKEHPPWEASASAKLSRFPLGAVAALSDRQIRGRASGEIAVSGLHRDAGASAKLQLESLEIGNAKFATAQVDAAVENGRLRGSARLAQAAAFADLRAELGMTWGAAIAPSFDPAQPVTMTLQAKEFPVSALTPFVEPAVSELDGTLDADARFSLPAGGKGAQASGYVAVKNGTVQVTTLGQEYHGIKGRVTLSPDGVLRLENASALGSTGIVMAAGVAQMDGLRVVSARATVSVPKSKPIPIGLQGVQMGDLYGEFAITAESSADGHETNIAVDVPTLHVRLPPSTPHTVQVLDEPKKIRVGRFRAPGQFVTLAIDGEDVHEEGPAPASPTRVNIAFKLGNDVTVERGTTLRIVLTGAPQVHVSDKVRMTGQIRLKSGTLDIQGKRFEIEKGTVTFVGDDPSNPGVVVTAGWTAADGTKVLADFAGPLKTGKVTLRSEPGRPQNEILALIMFGTADGSSATPYAQSTTDGATKAGTAAGGFATEGLSRGIDDLTGLDVATKVDTTDSANPRPEVELRIAKDISLQVAFVLGTPPPGANPDHTFATVDWRFLRNWSLATTFGDQGSSIADVVWRRRY